MLLYNFEELYKNAQLLCNKKEITSKVTVARVASALLTDKGDIFTGISIEAPCGIGFCAEHSAIAEMLKSGQSKIELILSVGEFGIISPCGRCRELIRQVNLDNYKNTKIAIDAEKSLTLSELLPNPFFSSKKLKD